MKININCVWLNVFRLWICQLVLASPQYNHFFLDEKKWWEKLDSIPAHLRIVWNRFTTSRGEEKSGGAPRQKEKEQRRPGARHRRSARSYPTHEATIGFEVHYGSTGLDDGDHSPPCTRHLTLEWICGSEICSNVTSHEQVLDAPLLAHTSNSKAQSMQC